MKLSKATLERELPQAVILDVSLEIAVYTDTHGNMHKGIRLIETDSGREVKFAGPEAVQVALAGHAERPTVVIALENIEIIDRTSSVALAI